MSKTLRADGYTVAILERAAFTLLIGGSKARVDALFVVDDDDDIQIESIASRHRVTFKKGE